MDQARGDDSRGARIERSLDRWLRSGLARIVGTVLGVGALVALVIRTADQGQEAMDAARSIGIGGFLGAVLAWMLFHVLAVAVARMIGLRGAWSVWANAQLLKYVPIPASAAVGFIGSAVRAGEPTRGATVLLVRHTGALAIGAALVGVGSVAGFLADSRWVGRGIAAVVLVVFLGLLTALVRRRMPVAAIGLATVAWIVAGLGIGMALAPASWLLLASAFAASWVAGQIVIPVPAGVGARELALFALLGPVLSPDRALVLTLTARLVTTVGDVVFALVIRAMVASRSHVKT